jgi:GT2 family glycosyltransferase
MDLSIIIVNYKSRAKLENCLRSLRAANLGGISREIIVVDNDSREDLLSLERDFPEIKLIKSAKNRGMGGGNNLGLEKTDGEYVLVLNPDTFITPGAITTLLNYLRVHPEAGLVGPKLLYPDRSLQYSCLRFPKFCTPLLRRTFLGEYFPKLRESFRMAEFDHQTIREVDWLIGSCLLFRRQLRLASGEFFIPRFDERYFMYFEDTDLCRQFWTNGFKVVYNPEAVVIHDHARDSAKHPWYLAIFLDRLSRVHIISWLKYFLKWGL